MSLYNTGTLNKKEKEKLFEKIKQEADVILFLFNKDNKSKENLRLIIKDIFGNELEPSEKYKNNWYMILNRKTIYSLFKEKFEKCDFKKEIEGLIFYNDNKQFYDIPKKYLKLDSYKKYTTEMTNYINNLPSNYQNVYVLLIDKNELKFFNVQRNEYNKIEKIIYGSTSIYFYNIKIKLPKI